MTEAGYTATEALVAMLILGLAVGGLATGIGVLGRTQYAATSTVTRAGLERAIADKLDRYLAGSGPFRSDQPDALNGDASGFDFACGAARCRVRLAGRTIVMTGADGSSQTLATPADANLQFAYVATQGTTSTWPTPPAPPPAQPWQVLQSISLTDQANSLTSPVAVVRLWVQQAANCEFDPITQDCRAATP